MSQSFNYRHLYYFWVVAKEGGLTRAAERLDMAVQTISAQVRQLEKDLGISLFQIEGRNLTLTEAGVSAMREADQIFELGQHLPVRVREASSGKSVRLAIGICDGVAKLAVHRLLEPILKVPHLRLLCHDGEFDQLMAEMANHQLDAVISDRPAQANSIMRLHNHVLADSTVAWYASETLAEKAQQDFPHCLSTIPVILPTTHGVLRQQIDHWFERLHIRPNVVGEFEDSALLTTFGAADFGVFPAAGWLDQYLTQKQGLSNIANVAELHERFYLIHSYRKVIHPLIERLVQEVRSQ
jgi:LysR family transcriptional regulator, transcriptional activator of nhaA